MVFCHRKEINHITIVVVIFQKYDSDLLESVVYTNSIVYMLTTCVTKLWNVT